MASIALSPTKDIAAFVAFLILGVVIVVLGFFLTSVLGTPLAITFYVVGTLSIIWSIITYVSNAPPTPTNVSVIDGDGKATVSFDGTGSSYTVISSPGGITATGTSSPIVVNGLTNGT